MEVIGLYEYFGFEYIDGLLGCIGYVDCEVWMLKMLQCFDIVGVFGSVMFIGVIWLSVV